MNSRKTLYDIAEFYRKGAVLNASYQGMRYQIQRCSRGEGEAVQDFLQASIWPEPFCYEKTSEELILQREFPYTEEGLDQIYAWLCENYEQERDRWEHARDNPMEGILY